MEKPERVKALEEAGELVGGVREDQYGDPFVNFEAVAAFWNVYLGALRVRKLAPEDVSEMMSLFKTARKLTGRPHRDNDLDDLGYTALAAEMRKRRD